MLKLKTNNLMNIKNKTSEAIATNLTRYIDPHTLRLEHKISLCCTINMHDYMHIQNGRKNVWGKTRHPYIAVHLCICNYWHLQQTNIHDKPVHVYNGLRTNHSCSERLLTFKKSSAA